MIDFLMAVLRLSTPLLFVALAGLICERSGVVNLALEAFMLVGAFTGATVAHLTGSPWMGWCAALAAGSLFASFYGLFVLEAKTDQIVTGTAFNLLAAGLIPFSVKILFDSTGSTPSLPLDSRFSWEPYAVAALTTFAVLYVFMKTRWGLRLRFAGENPSALQAAGFSVRSLRWTAVALSGGLAAWGGATLSMALASSYSPMMTAGRGFIGLAALIFGRWKPIPTILACLFFAAADAAQIRLQGAELFGLTVPVQFIQILPYLVTLVALAGWIGRSHPPKALGTPFGGV